MTCLKWRFDESSALRITACMTRWRDSGRSLVTP
eukprot:CAMPEP_0119531902 /NCGR_PEP_ID=MMETSP1344-20130328/45521_1 /TAXON_ID=236787 /ORGANISM="Florenciella parvula, Strain CCMP2471" /LENGTH=33 /DNA_ID= /DNA_START= /DNA_END= /DNA_ORIENTATION=